MCECKQVVDSDFIKQEDRVSTFGSVLSSTRIWVGTEFSSLLH